MESPEQPTLLMHYTNAEGLEGILKSKTLRLTHHSCTNDSMETIYTFNALKNLLKNNFEDIPTIFGELSEYISQHQEFYIFKNSSDYVKKIFPDCGTAKKIQPYLSGTNIYSFFFRFLQQFDLLRDTIDWYIFSFSRVDAADKNYNFFAQNGRLSQWRAYGNYALVFTKDSLETLKSKHEQDNGEYPTPEPVQYPRPDLKDVIDDFKQFFKTNCLTDFKGDLNKPENPLIFWDQYAKLVAFVKHLGFEEENEERLCVAFPKNTTDEYFIEHQKNYLKTNISGKKYDMCMNFEELPIDKIIIGPCKNQKEQEDKEKHLSTWLEENGYQGIEIGRSDIPYVGQYP